jgi:hypothetical protein
MQRQMRLPFLLSRTGYSIQLACYAAACQCLHVSVIAWLSVTGSPRDRPGVGGCDSWDPNALLADQADCKMGLLCAPLYAADLFTDCIIRNGSHLQLQPGSGVIACRSSGHHPGVGCAGQQNCTPSLSCGYLWLSTCRGASHLAPTRCSS